MPSEFALSVKAWNLMGGLDWLALPVVADMLGLQDIERLVADLATIRDWYKRSRD